MNTYLVFDLDGTLSDTQKIHEQIESDFLKEKWLNINPDIIWKRFAWRTPQEWISELLKSENIVYSEIEIEDFVSRKDEIVIGLLKQWKIELMPFAFETLNYLNNKWYKIWISSWACREFIDEFIKYFNLEKIVISSTSSNEVENKKPNPDVFLESFKKIEHTFWPADLKYVIWDWWSDVEWWYRSWAKTVWLNYLDKTKMDENYLDFEIKTLKELQNIL